jgi:hypothetical protein
MMGRLAARRVRHDGGHGPRWCHGELRLDQGLPFSERRDHTRPPARDHDPKHDPDLAEWAARQVQSRGDPQPRNRAVTENTVTSGFGRYVIQLPKGRLSRLPASTDEDPGVR